MKFPVYSVNVCAIPSGAGVFLDRKDHSFLGRTTLKIKFDSGIAALLGKAKRERSPRRHRTGEIMPDNSIKCNRSSCSPLVECRCRIPQRILNSNTAMYNSMQMPGLLC